MSMNPLRVLYTAFDVVPAPKGASVRIQHMLRYLGQLQQPNLAIQAVLLGEPGYPEHEVTPEGVQIQRLILPRAAFLERSVAFAEQVIAACLEFKPQVVHFRSLWDAYPLVRWRETQGLDFKLVYELHGLPEYELEHHFEDLSPALLHKVKQQQQVVLRAADIILSPSTVHMAYLQSQGIDPRKCYQVPNGVNAEHFTPATPALTKQTEQPEQPEQTDTTNQLLQLVYVGTLAPWQGLEHLLEATAQVTAPFQLQLVGKGQRRWVRDLMTRAFQLHLSHQLDIVGPVSYEQVPRYLQQADIALAPLDTSDRNCVQGCMPLKILEYMACGCAIIASDIPVNRALLSHEHNALLYPAEDTEALAAAIQRLAQDPGLRQRLGAQARADVLQHYAWQQSLGKIAEIYRRISEGSVPSHGESSL